MMVMDGHMKNYMYNVLSIVAIRSSLVPMGARAYPHASNAEPEAPRIALRPATRLHPAGDAALGLPNGSR